LIAIIAGSASAIWFFYGSPFDPFDDKRFSPEIWRTANEDLRARMCRDAIRRFIHPGLNESEVITLLGSPTDVQQDERRDRPIGTRSYRYWIGSWSFQGMDDAFLYVHFDSEGRVVRAEIYGY
jgi:hypothetical protein